MSDHAVRVYFVVGAVCAIGCRILLHRLKIEPSHYWSILLGEGTEAIFFTLFLWPVTLAAIVLWYVLKRSADRNDVELKARNVERAESERADPMSTMSFNDLLKKLDEQTKKLSKR